MVPVFALPNFSESSVVALMDCFNGIQLLIKPISIVAYLAFVCPHPKTGNRFRVAKQLVTGR